MELADIQQILKVAAAAPNQMGLPPLAKAPGFTGSPGQVQGQKAMPPLKPKPPISPRLSLTATTPPPLQSSQQASLGCISPSLPPPTLFKTPSSSSSSSAGSGGQMDTECMGDTPLSDSPPAASTAVHEEAGLSGRKLGTKAGSNAGSAKGSFPCRFCDQVFAFSGVLQAHMRFHLGILPHQCNICDYVAPDKATLIRHLRTHSGERPYVCRVCHYPFTVKANCERHLRKKHAKTSRKDIEKNIKYVTSTTTASMAAPITAATTQDTEADTTCRFCGDDLKTYRALQIHLRTHNGCQRKPFECRRCGAAFLAKRNCIHHLLKQHPEVQEREIEEHIATLLPATAAINTRTAPLNPMALNGISQPPIQVLQAVKMEDLASVVYPAELDQPLDFSAKGRGGGSQAGSPGVKLESASPTFDCSALDQPIDLSIPSKRQRREVASSGEKREIKTEQSGSVIEQQHALALSKDEKTAGALPPLHPHPQLGCYQLPPGSTPPPASLPNAARAQRLKPLLPKPAAATPPSTALKELPPLASIAQIISSVSAAPDLLKRDAASLEVKPQPGATSAQTDSAADNPGPSAAIDSQSDDLSEGSSRRRSRKKPAALAAKEKVVSSGIDLESSGEFASVEKMLATTDANKFSTYLQTGAAELPGKRDVDRAAATAGSGGEEKEGGEREEGKPAMSVPQSKGKKNAYSNSVQKMTCPFCPRVFPWASSLQRHMLTHTGQKPFPCPRCDAFFSTKSNCERHLLRKHGVTHRTLRRNGAIVKKEDDEGMHESAESQSETEQLASETHDLSGASTTTDSGHAPTSDNSAPCENSPGSPAHKASQAAEQQEAETSEQPDQQEAPETRAASTKQPPQSSKVESTDDDDCHSNKSLDLNFGKKLIDFKLSASSSSSAPQEEQPCSSSCSSSSSASSSSAPQEATESSEEKEKAAASCSTGSPVKQQPEYKHVCRVCRKSFRYATTLARHERAHLSEETPTPMEEASPAKEEDATESKAAEEEKDEMEMEAEEGGAKGGESEGGESVESEEEEKEKEERSDEEASEPKNVEGGETGGGRVDKRKKICNVCDKRFWSLQDLTRHMRSHTGERPYQCKTCERTFTLKHSLVRHQRIHLKPRGADGSSAANDDASEDGDSCTPTPTSTCPPSENESECGSAVARAKELEEEDVKEEGDGQQEDSGTVLEEGSAKLADSDPASEDADIKDKSELSADSSAQQPSSDLTPQATESKTTTSTDSQAAPDSSKDPSSSSPPPGGTATPAEGLIHGLLEIHTKPPLEHILPNGEPPLVGVD